jgi:hypothetical protein
VAFVQEITPYFAEIDTKKNSLVVKNSEATRNDHPGFPSFNITNRQMVRLACWRCGTDVTTYLGALKPVLRPR